MSDCIIKHCALVLRQGVIGELRVVGDPRAAARYCEDDEDDSDMVSHMLNRIKHMNVKCLVFSVCCLHTSPYNTASIFVELKERCSPHVRVEVT